MKKDVPIKAFTDVIFKTCLERFGPVTTKFVDEPKQSRSENELQLLKKEENAQKMLEGCMRRRKSGSLGPLEGSKKEGSRSPTR